MKAVPVKYFASFLRSALVTIAAPAFAEGTSPWENAVSVLQQAFTSTIARGLARRHRGGRPHLCLRAIKTNIADSLHLIVQVERRPGRRYISEVLFVNGYNSTRMLRLPGFANRNLPKEFIVQVRQESLAVYTRRDFTIEENSPRPFDDYRQRERTVSSDHKSQSEYAWAYAKRALARGDDPELVIRRIADYRSEDKADPDYYARHTVVKAQAELSRQSRVETPGTGDQARSKEIALDH